MFWFQSKFYSKCRSALNEFVPSVQIQQDSAQKLLKPSRGWKTYVARLSGYKGEQMDFDGTWYLYKFNILLAFKQFSLRLFWVCSYIFGWFEPHCFCRVRSYRKNTAGMFRTQSNKTSSMVLLCKNSQQLNGWKSLTIFAKKFHSRCSTRF